MTDGWPSDVPSRGWYQSLCFVGLGVHGLSISMPDAVVNAKMDVRAAAVRAVVSNAIISMKYLESLATKLWRTHPAVNPATVAAMMEPAWDAKSWVKQRLN